MTEKLPPEEDLRKSFQAELAHSGFTFENKVEKILRKNNFSVKREVPFLDKDDPQEGRRIDFTASGGVIVDRMKMNKVSINMGELRLVVECKSHPNYGWIFFKGKHFENKPAEEIYFKEPAMQDYKYLPKAFIKELFFASSYIEIVHPMGPKEKKHNSPEILFTAVTQVTKATRYQIDHEKKIMDRLLRMGFSRERARSSWDFIILQPLIVFGGNMYKVSDDDGKLEPIDFAQIDKEWVSKNYEEAFGEIHIVSFRALEKYIDILQDHYDFAHNPKSKIDKIYKEHEERLRTDWEKKKKEKKWFSFFKRK